MKFFSSDLHFGNDNALKLDDRPFKNSKAFAKYIIKTWNRQAGKNDEIYVLGDFVDYHKDQVCNWEEGLRVVCKLKAKVTLIIGNNEEKLIKACFNGDFEKFKDYCLKLGFKDVLTEHYILIDDIPFHLTHKPINHSKRMLTLFGHCHRAMGLYKSFGFNMDCDLNHFKLFSEENIKNFLLKKRDYWDSDEDLRLI